MIAPHVALYKERARVVMPFASFRLIIIIIIIITQFADQGPRDESQRLQCRFYEEQYPNPESMVMVKVINIADMAAEVILLEYNDIEVSGQKDDRWGL